MRPHRGVFHTCRARRMLVGAFVASLAGWCSCLTGAAAERGADSDTKDAGEGGDCDAWNTREFFQSATQASIAACLDAGAVLNGWDGELAPLHWAVGLDNAEAVAALLAAGADVDIGKVNLFTPLHGAKSTTVAGVLLAHDADVGAYMKAGRIHTPTRNSRTRRKRIPYQHADRVGCRRACIDG